jgi:DNA primase
MEIDRLIRANKVAAAYFFEHFKKDRRAKSYVYDRIDKETVNKFRIGYAPKESIIPWLKKHQISAKEALEIGLIYKGDKRYQDVFLDRIMFPIAHAGVIVGFGGRALGKSKAKYINSKASLLYNKSEILYGLWFTRKWIHKLKYAVATEGYFDVLSLYSQGIKNVVAVCGTTFSQEHAKSLLRWALDLKILFDGDEAGKEAAKKAKTAALREGLAVKIIRLPDSLDPDEYVKKKGSDRLVKLLEKI